MRKSRGRFEATARRGPPCGRDAAHHNYARWCRERASAARRPGLRVSKP